MKRLFMAASMLTIAYVVCADDLHLVWSDEFNGDGAPDSTVWNFEEGFVRNQEAQWYQTCNAWQQDGRLIIEARREHRNNPTYDPTSRHWGKKREFIDYTSACLTTAGKKNFLYGRLEVRARIPTAPGAWPAIWTLGSEMEWPSCGEIDVMEYYRIGDKPHILANAAWGNDQRYYAVWNSQKIPFDHFIEKNREWADQFHIWRMDWDEEHIRIYLDEELLNDIPLSTTVNGSIGRGENPFRKPQYILLNLALGGQNGGVIDDTALPMRYEIDYVRIYQSEHRIYVNPQEKTDVKKGVFATVNEALRQAESFADDSVWTTINIAPGVYWIDDPDDSAIRKPEPGENTPYGMKLRLTRTRIIGMGDRPEDVVLACNRGQTQGADGNFTMLHITGDDIQAENLTFGNYCNVDLNYPRDPRLSRQRRADAIVQAQLVTCNGNHYEARNCRFISRLNLCPFVGARHALFENCYFECTDDALCGTGTYRHCRFTFFSSKPFYCTSPQGAVFEDCDIHSKVQGVQYLTKVSDPVMMRNCRWTSDDPNLTIAWTKKPNPKKHCQMENCTLNGKPLDVPMPPDVPMPVTTPLLPMMNQPALAAGRWTLDAFKPKDTADYDWNVDGSRPAWCYGEGLDGAEGCYGLIQNVRGARMMYTGKTDEHYDNQTLMVELSPCKSAGQGFGSATGQYLDLCIKFDTQTLTGLGLRFVRTPAYDKAVEVMLVEYCKGEVTPLSLSQKCVLFKKGCRVTLSAKGNMLQAQIENDNHQQQLSAIINASNSFGGIHIQHTGSTGPSATVIQSLNCIYE